jgi:hypothetical protein
MQTVLPVAIALTYPGGLMAAPGGIRGALLDEANRWSVAVPLATIFVTGLVNWAYCLPVTNSITDKRRAQGTWLWPGLSARDALPSQPLSAKLD